MKTDAGSLTCVDRNWLKHSARTAVAAMVSLLVARLFTLPEAYWSAITTLIVMQSSLGAALGISVRRFAPLRRHGPGRHDGSIGRNLGSSQTSWPSDVSPTC